MKFTQSVVVVTTVLILIGAVYFVSRLKLPQTTSTNNKTNTVVNSLISPFAQFGLPLNRALERITKKPFGIYITPKTSPVQPEKFTGYHTGTDFETFASEADGVVSVKAVAVGKVVYRKWVSGYGGVMIQTAEVNGQPVTILYGHLALDSIVVHVGDGLVVGQVIGHLGQGYSHDTDGERKHLHLGVHKGSAVVLLGYVPKSNELSQWIDATILWQSK